MTRLAISLAGIGAAMLLAAGPAAADTIFDVEHARAQARAGRYLTDQDVDMLNRWGDLSGSPRYYYPAWPGQYYDPYPRPRRYYRRYYHD